MAKINKVDTKYAELIAKDMQDKTSTMYIDSSYVHNSGGSAPVEDITELTDAIEVTTSVSLVTDYKVAVTMNETISSPYSYDRIYFVNKDDFILYVVDINKVDAISEINEDIIINLSDVANVIN
jgi:hypothetical protein